MHTYVSTNVTYYIFACKPIITGIAQARIIEMVFCSDLPVTPRRRRLWSNCGRRGTHSGSSRQISVIRQDGRWYTPGCRRFRRLPSARLVLKPQQRFRLAELTREAAEGGYGARPPSPQFLLGNVQTQIIVSNYLATFMPFFLACG
jgi:hypothetical protein